MSLRIIKIIGKRKWGNFFDILIQIIILLSLVAFSIETLPNLDDEIHDFLRIFEIFIVVVFTIEYFLRLYYAPKKLKFVFSFLGIIDLIAIIPFYLTLGLVDLNSIRIFRFIRVIQIFKLVRYNRATARFYTAFKLAREELVLFTVSMMVVFYLSGVGIYYFEHEIQPAIYSSVIHSLWWAVITLTTVGYGDMVPITIGGKVFTFFVLMVGLGIIAVPSGIIASALSKAREVELEKQVNKSDKK